MSGSECTQRASRNRANGRRLVRQIATRCGGIDLLAVALVAAVVFVGLVLPFLQRFFR